MTETVEIIQPMLGLRPYILVESRPDPDAPQGFDLNVRAGGGIDSKDEMVALLLLVVESITGVSTDPYTLEVDAARAAARPDAADERKATP